MMQILNEKGFFIAACSQTGTYHISSRMENQDRYLYGSVGNDTFFIALSDGVSSAPFAGEGADAAVRTVQAVSESIASEAADITDIKGIQTYIVQDWKRQFPSDWNSYAATLNFVIFHRNRALIGRIGDGLIVSRIDDVDRCSAADEEFFSSETAALGEAINRRDFDLRLFSAAENMSVFMTSDGIGKEIAEKSRMSVNRYLLNLSEISEKQFEKEVVSWIDDLGRKNGDDKTIVFLRWGNCSAGS